MPYVRGISVDFGRDVLWLWKQAGATRAPNLRVESETVSGRVVPDVLQERGIAHAFETASIIPAFTPSWNTTIPVARIDSAKFFPRFSVAPQAKNATLDYALVRGVAQSVGSYASTFTINHNLNDATAVILVQTNWNTTIKRVSKSANSMVVGFNVTAPESGGLIYWSDQSDDTDIYENGEMIDANAEQWTIYHNAGTINLPMFFLPSWNTVIWFFDRRENETTVKFSTSAPSNGSGLLDWKIKEVT
jgi:hypothetical protein